MFDQLRFDRSHPGHYGMVVELSPLVRRVVANNPGPFTFTGTVSHIVGRGNVAVIDPGPDDLDHLAAILAATSGENVTHILVTHDHRDHTDGVDALWQATGAQVVGSAPRGELPKTSQSQAGPSSPSGYGAYRLDRALVDGERLHGEGWTLEAIATPGHASDHLAFSLLEESALFSGDHVMAWSTTVVAPPDGSMGDYRRSLHKLLGRSETTYYPGHGPSLSHAHAYVRALLQHRERREQDILGALSNPMSIPDLVRKIYPGIAPALSGGAGLSVQAHLDELMERGSVVRTGGQEIPVRFSLV